MIENLTLNLESQFYYKYKIVMFSAILFCAISCKKNDVPARNSILFLSHIYKSKTRIDPRVEQLNLNKYEHIWLGGDICGDSDIKYSTLEYINKVLKVDQPGNYWALGNHDVEGENYDWLEKITGKKDFYTIYHKGLNVIVLNTNLEPPECERLKLQNDMFQNVCDTIQESSHLIILSHHVVWNHVKEMPSLWHRANANYPAWQSRCKPMSRFDHVLYNRLVEVQKRGIQVIFISGDYGQKEKQFQFRCNEGVWFIGSGIDHSNRLMPDTLKNTAKDLILLLNHSPENRTLDWQFLDLDSLLEEQNSIF